MNLMQEIEDFKQALLRSKGFLHLGSITCVYGTQQAVRGLG